MTSEPRPSATACVLHQTAAGIEVLMVRRSSSARFMAGAWVFPGGAVDPEDHDPENLALLDGFPVGSENGPWLAAAFREVVEETGIWLTRPPRVEPLNDIGVFATAHRQGRAFAADAAVYFANWVTPSMVPVRFDARFFIVAIEDRVVPHPDGLEIDAAEYVAPTEALRRAAAGEWLVPFPTQRTLHDLAGFRSVPAALEEWRHRPVVRVQPRLRVGDGGALEVVMPGEPGFDELEDAGPDPEALAQAARVAAGNGSPVVEVARGED
ncbi:MAG: NUDIX domain-containing protein [Acidimicrobiia bacterium]